MSQHKALADLAVTLRKSASAHRDLAATLAEFDSMGRVSNNLRRLAALIDETAAQIEGGEYGDPTGNGDGD